MKVSIARPAQARLQVTKPTFMLVGMMRSGSNFLERTLGLLPSIRCHGELFNQHFVGLAAEYPQEFLGYRRDNVHARNKDSVAFLNAMIQGCDRQAMGFRMFLDHDTAVMSEALYNPAIKKVVLTRNLLDSFVSLEIARETDVWLTTETRQSAEPDRVNIDVNDFTAFALRQSMFYNDVLTILQRTGQPYFHIDYAEIKELSVLNGLVEFLGVPDRFSTAEEPIKRQNPGSQQDKISNYSQVVEQLRQRRLARWFI
jgi:hypothetical protein